MIDVSELSRHADYQQFLIKQSRLGLLRELPRRAQSHASDFSSNDYLGLSTHPEVVAAACDAAKRDGVGSTGSRLLSGNYALISAFEDQIAQDKGCEAALIFSSGFQANSSVLAALLDTQILSQPPLVFTDKLIHASLHQGCQLSGVKQIRFQHNHLGHLRERLLAYREQQCVKWIVTESVFGMDGDALDMPSLMALADAFNAQVFVDEAHATGIYGKSGYGLCAGLMMSEHGVSRGIAMGTFSKALGGSGAYIACSKVLKDYLMNRCGGFIYSTAPSPMQIAGTKKAWELLPQLHASRTALLTRAQQLRVSLNALGFDTGTSNTHIIPILLHSEALALSLKQYLLDKHIIVSAIRPPTVPSARLRLALNVLHDDAGCEYLLDALRDFKKTNDWLKWAT
jgi:8-amino-7-oxononanoate synthase